MRTVREGQPGDSPVVRDMLPAPDPVCSAGELPKGYGLARSEESAGLVAEGQSGIADEKGLIEFVIFGEPASKANSRRIAVVNRKPRVIKSAKALFYGLNALRQIPVFARKRLEGPVSVSMTIFYATERPDLDESLILDLLQDIHSGSGESRKLIQAGVYRNDRQVREKHIYHGIDRDSPRVCIRICSLEPKGKQDDQEKGR